MNITTIIFDWGGVLAPDSIHMAAKALSEKYKVRELEAYNVLYQEKDYSTSNISDPYYEQVSKKLNVPAEEIRTILNKQNEWEVMDLAKELKKKKYNLFLLSDQMKPKADAILNSHHLDFFDDRFFSNEIGHIKTEKAAFEIVLKKINKNPQECVFIDDRPSNIQVAQSVGLHTILFDSLVNLIKDLKEKYNISIEQE